MMKVRLRNWPSETTGIGGSDGPSLWSLLFLRYSVIEWMPMQPFLLNKECQEMQEENEDQVGELLLWPDFFMSLGKKLPLNSHSSCCPWYCSMPWVLEQTLEVSLCCSSRKVEILGLSHERGMEKFLGRGFLERGLSKHIVRKVPPHW